MMQLWKCTILILVLREGLAQNASETEAENEVDPQTEETPTSLAPLVPTDAVCNSCVCRDKTVDCSELQLKKFFTLADWAGLTEMNPVKIDLHGNIFTNITPIADLPVEVLDLSYCEIEFIEKSSFMELQNMHTLDLSHNLLTSQNLSPHAFQGKYSPREFEPLAAMRVLNLSYNKLHSLSDDLFEHMPELTHLDLSGNPLEMIDHVTLVAIASLPDLEVLKLRSCQLEEIPERFLHTLRSLQTLDLSDNLLKTVPQEIEEAKSLVYLNLNTNPISMLDASSEDFPGFPKLPKLEELHMSNMPELETIGEGTLAGLTALKRLHICNNDKLDYIHPKAMAAFDEVGESDVWPELTDLYLHSNNLTEVDRRLVSRWDLLKTIDVTDNPYLCECSTQWMVDSLVPIVEKLDPGSAAMMVCKFPVEMEGKTMKHLNEQHSKMRCVDKYGNRPERDGALLLGALIGVLLAVPIMMTIVLLWRRGYFAPCGAKGPASFSRAFYKRAQSEDFNY